MFADIHHYVAMRYTNSAPGHPPSTIPATGSTPPCLDIPLTSPRNRNSAAVTPPQLDTAKYNLGKRGSMRLRGTKLASGHGILWSMHNSDAESHRSATFERGVWLVG
jgi:hypothetical protein